MKHGFKIIGTTNRFFFLSTQSVLFMFVNSWLVFNGNILYTMIYKIIPETEMSQ